MSSYKECQFKIGDKVKLPKYYPSDIGTIIEIHSDETPEGDYTISVQTEKRSIRTMHYNVKPY
jgi:Lon protease-like protein